LEERVDLVSRFRGEKRRGGGCEKGGRNHNRRKGSSNHEEGGRGPVPGGSPGEGEKTLFSFEKEKEGKKGYSKGREKKISPIP